MLLQPKTLYHVYNRGNNKQKIFFQAKNYDYFKKKACLELGDQIYFMAFCLMPNHFHFLIYTKSDFEPKKFSSGLRTLLSSYTRAINKQESTTGSLFQQNTKFKQIDSDEYSQICLHYIHQNPLKSRLVKKMEDWPHHSFNEYWKNEEGLCNTALAKELIRLAPDFYEKSYQVISNSYEKIIL